MDCSKKNNSGNYTSSAKHENLKSIEELELASLDKFEDKRNISPLSSQESVDVDPENDFVQSTHLKYCYSK